jgi:hypothetical protein
MSDKEEIMELKARYFRFLDTKQWEAIRDLFTENMRFYRNEETEPSATSSAEFVASLERLLSPAVTVHHGHMPEIDITGPNSASATWALFDYVDDPSRNVAIKGYGRYYDQLEKGPDGRWRISELRVVRTRVDRIAPTPAEAVEASRNLWLGRL